VRRALTLACLGLIIWTGTVQAHTRKPDGWLARLGGIKLGDQVKIEFHDLSSIEGRLLGSHADTLVLATDRGEPRVTMSSINRLWVRGRSVKQGARSGAIVGAVLGGVALLLVAPMGQTDGTFTFSDAAGAIAAGGLVGGLYIGGAGAVLGAAVTRWNLRYQSSISDSTLLSLPSPRGAHGAGSGRDSTVLPVGPQESSPR
jgi:hypothetical protein